MTFTPLPILGSTDWYGWAQDLEAEVSKVADKADATATLLKWAATTAVVANEIRLAPDGKIIQRNSNGTTRSTYDSTEQAAWTAVSAVGGVSSVNTRTGAITLTRSDVGLGAVDNTSDVNKPISTATQAALDTATAALATTNAALTDAVNRITDLEGALAAKADLVDGALDPSQMPTLASLTLVDSVSQATAELTYDSASDHFVKVTPS